MRIVCFGPGPKFKGGISNYNTSLAKALDKREENEVFIVSWTQQYPAIVPREYIDKASRNDLLEGTRIKVHYITNYNNPITWRQTAKYIADLRPDKVIFQWSLAVQGLPLGRIVRRLKRLSSAEIIFDLHFVIQKENSSLDARLTKMGISKADSYITHAYKTVDELRTLFPNKEWAVTETGERAKKGVTVIKLFHPIYDLFSPDSTFDVAAFKEEHGLKKHCFLFFGFIRKYKGLHYAIDAFNKVAQQRDDVSMMICGESFWKTLDQKKLSTKIKNVLWSIAKFVFVRKEDNEQDYRPLKKIAEYGLEDRTLVVNQFIANEDVHKYFQTCDAVVLFYEYATPSGIESLSYNFKKPLIATRVGHFPETIDDGFNGYLAAAEDVNDMAAQMERFITKPLPAKNVAEKTQHLSWENYASAILHS